VKLVRLYTWSGKGKLYVMGRTDTRDPRSGRLIPTAGRWTAHRRLATPFTMAEARALTRRLRREKIRLKIEAIADHEAAMRQLVLDVLGRAA
jgi:hypothetical protein